MQSKSGIADAKNLRSISVNTLYDTSETLIKIIILLTAAAHKGETQIEFEGALNQNEAFALRDRGFYVEQLFDKDYYQTTERFKYLDKYTIRFDV